MEIYKIKGKYEDILNQSINICNKYGLDISEATKLIDDIKGFRVTTPVIGGFSSGKSSMINAIIEENLLATNIEAETAIPAEIYYGENRVRIYDDKGNEKVISIEEYKDMSFNVNKTRLVKIEHSNGFLNEIKDVKIVDMPGFDSGIEVHNRSIDDYLPNSLAYIITFEAGEPIKESIIDFLSELKLHNTKVFIVITKCDTCTESDVEESVEFMKNNISTYLDVNEVRVACVKSKRNRNVEEVKTFLLEIQKEAEKIFEVNYGPKVKAATNSIEKYIKSRLNNKELSASQLLEKEKEIEKSMSEVMVKMKKEEVRFEEQVRKCIEVIKVKISSDLSSAESTFENMIMNGQDVKEKINFIVRNAITNGIKTEFEPKLRKYFSNISDMVSLGGDIDVTINLDQFKTVVDNVVKDTILKVIPVILGIIGAIFTGPFGGVIAGILTSIVESLFAKKQQNDKRALIKEKINNEIIPQVTSQAGEAVEAELLSYLSEINEEIRKKITNEKEVIQKSLEDIRNQRLLEEEKQALELEQLEGDLKELGAIVNGI